jgi:hypothetical protein
MNVIDISNKKIIVFDCGGPFGVENKCFDREYVKERHGMAACYLYEKCLERGIQLLTPDLFYKFRSQIKKAIFIRNNVVTSDEDRLKKEGAYPALLFGFEYPLYAPQFYWNAKKITAQYDHVFMPRGAESIVAPKVAFHPWISPQPYSKEDKVMADFSKRKFLMIINGNARIHVLKRLYATVYQWLKPIPTLVNRELYRDRLEAIRYFAKNDDFDLYGRGWDKPVRYSFERYDKAIQKTWQGEVADKQLVLQKYKFAICFENCIFSGWITEKIIDCLFAGCIPVYWGDPNIEKYIPKGCFIDFRDFKNFSDLEKYMRGITEEEYNRYIKNINEFIASPLYYEFSQQKYVDEMIPLFETYF